MRFEFKPSFDRSVKALKQEEKEDIKALCVGFLDILTGERQLVKGIGLKNLKNNFWEIRKGLTLRILFRWEKELVEFILAGNHDQIKAFLKKS